MRLTYGFLAAFLTLIGAAHAQNATVTNHAFVIGKGPGVSGYTSLLCGSAQLAVGQPASDPICRTFSGDATFSATGVLTFNAVNANVGVCGDGTHVAQITLNAKGLATGCVGTLITGAPPTGAAGGRLAGTYPNPTSSTQPANTTECNATGGVAVPTYCNATTMRTNIGVSATGADTTYNFRANNLSDVASAATARTNLGLAIGTNVEAWDADLDCFAALATTGAVQRTGAGTCTTGTLGVALGGTGQVTLTANAFLTGNGAGAINAVAITGLILGNGASAPTAYGGSTPCTNQFVTALSVLGVATCTTDVLASAQHANQGTTTTVLHGNAAGNPAFGPVAIGTDVGGLGTGVAAALAVAIPAAGAVVTNGSSAVLQASPSLPTGTTSGTGVMMGMGTTCKLTPASATRVQLNFRGSAGDTALGGIVVSARFGTGVAPANGAAVSGTQVGVTTPITPGVINGNNAFNVGGNITGLSVGTAYWFDMTMLSGGGTVSLTAISCDAFEIP